MSTIIPTEEQKQAAFDFFASDQPNAWHQDWIAGHVVPEPASNDEETQSMVDLAQLLAEREAKLREEIYRQAWDLGGISALATSRTRQDYDRPMALPALDDVAALLADYDTLRARVAELGGPQLPEREAKLSAAYAAVVRDVEQSELDNVKLRARVAELEATEIDPMVPIKRGDVLYSPQHNVLGISLGDGRSLFIRGDGALVDRGTESPIRPGEAVHVFDEPKELLATVVRGVRALLAGGEVAS